MRVQSNGLPLNCFNGTNVVREQNIDFELFWNPKTGTDKDGKAINVVTFDVNSNEKYSKILCEPEKIKNTWASKFLPKSGSNNLDNAIGVTLDGVILMPNLEQLVVDNANSGSYVDGWYPDSSKYANWSTYYPSVHAVDTCLGSITSSGEYHFRSAS